MISETGKTDGERPETEAANDSQASEAAKTGAQTSQWAGGAGAAYEESANDAEGEVDPTAERMAALEAENADVKDRMLRLAAEMENLRRRTEREIKDARTYAVSGFAREMLSVADNLSRALEAVPEEHRNDESSGLKALIEGVDMTEKGLLSALEKHGVKKLDPEGQRFDPNFHQAMFEIPNTEVPNGTVLQVVQAGYAIGDRVLRPAMVGVSKGGPKQAPAEKKPADATADEGGTA